MFTLKCPHCQSGNIKKSGLRNHVQHYKCKKCGKQFRGGRDRPSSATIWQEYLEGKQTLSEIATKYHLSMSTIQRMLRKQVIEWSQPSLTGLSGFVHIDATY